ncbi:DNA/RNA non-specific endonuclease [Streptomyces sp. NPDC059373]
MSCQSRFGKTSSSSSSSSSSSNGGGGGGGGGGGVSAADAARAAAAAAAAEAARRAAIRANAVKITASIGKGSLSVHSTAVATSPSAKINLSNSIRNAISAGVAGLTTAAVCVVTGGCDITKNKDKNNENCSWGSGIGYQMPGALDDEGRSTGMYACVTKSSVRPSGSSPVPKSARNQLSGHSEARAYARSNDLDASQNINACHLVADTRGGSGTDQRNLATCWRGVNTFDRSAGSRGRNIMAAMEREVKMAAKTGQSVAYTVTPQYRSDTSKVPYRFVLTARGYYNNGTAGLGDTMMVDNTYGSTEVNLGDVVK